MVAVLRVSTEGGRQIEHKLAGLVEAFGDLEPLMDGLGLYLESSTIERFETETAPDGSRWTPSLRAKQEGGKTLTDRGQLRSSVTHEAGSDWTAVGSNKVYAGIHNQGGVIRAKSGPFLTFALPGGLGFRRVAQVKIPARTFIGISREDEDELVALSEDFARDALGEA